MSTVTPAAPHDQTGSPSPARDRLIQAAIESFAQKGFAATTTRDIASLAGMSPAAVYVHHSTKEDLLFQISLRGHQSALQVMLDARATSSDPTEQITAMVREFSRWHAERSREGRIVHSEFHALTPEHRAEIAALRRRIERETQQVLEAGLEAGQFHVDDIKGTVLALLSLSIDLVRWFEPSATDRSRLTADHLARLHADLARRMLSAN